MARLLLLLAAAPALARLAAAEAPAFRSSPTPSAARALQASCWTAPIADVFMDVDVSCGFPPEDQVVAAIREREASVVKISSEIYIAPDVEPLDIHVLPDGFQGSDLGPGDDISAFLEPHEDTCAGHFAPKSGVDVYNNIKAFVDTFDIYTKCTKVYVPNKENGVPKMRKDDIIAIVTEPFPGHFTLSYEDVAQYQEYTDSEGTKTLLAIITSRKENVIEGNYDVTVQLFPNNTVRLAYTKRQNLAEALLSLGTSQEGYIVTTQDSVDRTMLKLAYAGRYGPGALDDDSGCYVRKWCTDYFTLQVGEPCDTDRQCVTGKCEKVNWLCLWGCSRQCAA